MAIKKERNFKVTSTSQGEEKFNYLRRFPGLFWLKTIFGISNSTTIYCERKVYREGGDYFYDGKGGQLRVYSRFTWYEKGEEHTGHFFYEEDFL